MKKIQVEKIDAVLKAEADACTLIRGHMCNDAGRCAVGALVFAATGEAPEAAFGPSLYETRAIKKKFGIPADMLDTIMGVNDTSLGGPMERYQDVMGIVEFARFMQDNSVSLDDLSYLYRSEE